MIDTDNNALPLPKFNAEHAFLRKFGAAPDFGANPTTTPMMATAAKIWAYTKAFLVFATKAIIFVAFPQIFIAGLILGVICDEICYAAVGRIKAVWDNQHWLVKIGMAVGAFYGVSTIIFAVPLLTGSHLGAKFYQDLPSD